MPETLTAPTSSAIEAADIKSLLPVEKIKRNVDAWSKQYQENTPYPHIGIDDFFDDQIIRRIVASFPGEFDASWNRTFLDAGAYEEQKLGLDRLEDFPPFIQHFINALNSRLFISFVEKLTGIPNLIPDPYLSGGGLHMIPNGGRLGIHADFNKHNELKLDRRVNLIVYLNYDWNPGWGGALELWDKDVQVKGKAYMPIANRIVAFTVTDTAMHGHPDPLTSPKGRYRKSIALYYYTNGRPEHEQSDAHTTIFKMRPNEVKKRTAIEAIKPFVPPIVWQVRRLFK